MSLSKILKYKFILSGIDDWIFLINGPGRKNTHFHETWAEWTHFFLNVYNHVKPFFNKLIEFIVTIYVKMFLATI